MKAICRYASLIMVLVTLVLLCKKDEVLITYADQSGMYVPVLTSTSTVGVNQSFGSYMSTVDCNIYHSMSKVNGNVLINIFGKYETDMFKKACNWINPCMAFATTWGEAGSSYPGISMTTVMDFNPNTYIDQVDWLNLSANLEQVDSSWYIVNSKQNYNTNDDGSAYHMPNALLQIPKGGDRSTHLMTGLGVGPYQITSDDWATWDLDDRVNPVWGFENSLKKCGTAWINCGINPISDLTVYAALSLGHQGGGLITMDFGKSLIELINTPNVQEAINRAGYNMFMDLLEKSYTREVSLADIDVGPYSQQVEAETGVTFSRYTGGAGSTNKGSYVLRHCIRYVFYKYYFTSGDYNKQAYKDNQIWQTEQSSNLGLAYQSDYVSGTHEHIAYKQSEFIHDISGNASIAGAGCGWCSLTSAMAELNPAMCGGITPVDWLSTPMSSVGEAYWGSGGMYWSGPEAWIDTINEIGIYGTYSVMDKGEGVSSKDVVEAIMKYAGAVDKVVVVSASAGLFTNGGHIMCVTDTEGDFFHIADSSTRAADYLNIPWSDMCNYNVPGYVNGELATSVNGYTYNFKCYWVICKEE